MHLLRCEDDFFSSYLFPWIKKHHMASQYQDTILYLRDEKMTTNRLVIGLLFPHLKDIDSFNLAGTLNIFMEDWKKETLHLKISTLLSNDMTEQDDVNYVSEGTGDFFLRMKNKWMMFWNTTNQRCTSIQKLKRKLILYVLRDTKKKIASGIAIHVISTSDTWKS